MITFTESSQMSQRPPESPDEGTTKELVIGSDWIIDWDFPAPHLVSKIKAILTAALRRIFLRLRIVEDPPHPLQFQARRFMAEAATISGSSPEPHRFQETHQRRSVRVTSALKFPCWGELPRGLPLPLWGIGGACGHPDFHGQSQESHETLG